MRKIIHIDMDAFFASIEQRDNEQYRGKPLAVGYGGNRGVVAAASYEARRYGVHSAMSSKVAQRKCPMLIFTPARFHVYGEVSQQIMNIFLEYTDLVEPLSIDEAFLDVTVNHKNIPSATLIAKEIKERIYSKTNLTASAGIANNKFLAKIASDINKPNGIYVIKPSRAEEFVSALPIEKFYGVGKVTAKRMHQLGVKTGGDLQRFTEAQLITLFGKVGSQYYLHARGLDYRPVEPNRIRKSVGAENTFSKDIDKFEELYEELEIIARDLATRLVEDQFEGKTFTLKVKYSDFTTISRSKTFSSPILGFEMIYKIAKEVLHDVDISPKIRLLGISIKNSDSHIWTDAIQLTLDFKDWEF